MARFSTRKGHRSNRRSTYRGGAASLPNLPASAAASESCVTLLRKVLPEEHDFERMQESDYKNVQNMNYEEFVEYNVARVEAMSAADCVAYKSLFELVYKGLVRSMDMEVASAHTVYNAFFDGRGRLVVVQPR